MNRLPAVRTITLEASTTPYAVCAIALSIEHERKQFSTMRLNVQLYEVRLVHK